MTPACVIKALSTVRVPSSIPGSLVVCAAVMGLSIGFGEVSHRISSTRRLGTIPSAGGAELIIILGYRNRGHHPNHLNRFRVKAGLRSIDPGASASTLIFCGGPVAGDIAEARLMERCARERFGFAGSTLVDTTSASTWENIVNAIPLIDEAFESVDAPGAIKIVSNSHHAEKARDHLWCLRPDLARRLTRGGDYRFGELPLVKPVAAVLGLAALHRLRLNRVRGVGD